MEIARGFSLAEEKGIGINNLIVIDYSYLVSKL
jgi:hypothetical protein